MDKLFGTDGIRGVAGEFPLDEHTIKVVGRSLATRMAAKLGRPPRLVIGRDTRESGTWIERAFYSGASIGAAECRSAGVITTPGVAFLTREFGFDAGIVISASHNPFQDNGLKIFAPSGKKIEETAERLIEQDIRDGSADLIADAASDIDDSEAEKFRDAYLDYLAGQFPSLSLAGTKIVVDCSNGAASNLAPVLFGRLGADVVSINDAPDGRNINKNCGSLHLEELQDLVAKVGADLGVAFDGDADRSLFVDEFGDLVDGDATLWILARYFDEHGALANRAVVATVMSNIGLELALGSNDIKLVRTSVGDKYVLDELLRSETAIGGEQSGHIIIPQKSLVGDGMMTTLFVLEAMFEKKAPLSKFVEGFTRYPQILLNVKVREKLPFESVPPIAAAAKQVDDELKGKGRLLLRYSGTENLARVMIEGKEQTEIEEQANRLADVIRESLG
ncbi:MAG: phosphoglucosamine mutase [Pyrinomonadaceae bacterium]